MPYRSVNKTNSIFKNRVLMVLHRLYLTAFIAFLSPASSLSSSVKQQQSSVCQNLSFESFLSLLSINATERSINPMIEEEQLTVAATMKYQQVDPLRYNQHHMEFLFKNPEKWSRDFSQFPGVEWTTEFENNYRYYNDDIQEWMRSNWTWTIWISVVYIAVITGLHRWMKNRKPFDLRPALTCWSGALALFSMIGTSRCLPEFIHILRHHGFVKSFCNSFYYADIRLNLWYLIFVWSKVIELGDTIFIVLRKQKLHKLHWIHHVLTLIFCWFVFGDVPATARWMVNMNFVVHTAMYGYYTAKALRIQVSRPLAISVTVAQITQMIFGFVINVVAVYRKITGQKCDLCDSVAVSGFLLYGLFFGLFLNFFIRAYIFPTRTKLIHKINKKKIILSDSNNNDNKMKDT